MGLPCGLGLGCNGGLITKSRITGAKNDRLVRLPVGFDFFEIEIDLAHLRSRFGRVLPRPPEHPESQMPSLFDYHNSDKGHISILSSYLLGLYKSQYLELSGLLSCLHL